LPDPSIAQAQQLPPGVPRVASTPIIGRLGDRFFTPPADAIDLPDDAHLE
jgi:hypothetical protein